MSRLPRINARLKRTLSTPIYNIGAASKLSGLPIWTLRWIERHGLVAPKRTRGNQRLYSDADVALLEVVGELMEQKVNLAGIRIIIRMRAGEAPPPPYYAQKPRAARRKPS